MREYRRERGEYSRKKPEKPELTYLFRPEYRTAKMAAGP
jgi:hypothetical protein